MKADTPATNESVHITRGVRRILEHPSVYRMFQSMLSPPAGWNRVVDEYLRPFPGARILDIGCGPGTMLEHLPDDVEYVGYDVNPRYIEQAKARYGPRGRFFCSDVESLEPPPRSESSFDFALALAVLHHLSDSEANSLVVLAAKSLKPGGVFFTLDCVYIPNQSAIARFLISRDRGQAVRTVDGYMKLLSGDFSDVTPYITHDLLRVPYTHLMMRAVRSGDQGTLSSGDHS